MISTGLSQTIVSSADGGIFVHNGTPALGNPPVLALPANGVKTDPYGNPVTSGGPFIRHAHAGRYPASVTCGYCRQPLPHDGRGNCGNCGAPTEATP
jgi:hypothetical protein